MKAFTPFIIMGLSVGMYFMYISPIISDIQLERVKKDEYTSILDKVKELKVKREAITAKYTQIGEEDLAALNKIVPNKFDPVVFSNNVNAIAVRNHILLKNIKTNAAKTADRGVSPDAGGEKYNTMISNITVTGKYEDFVKFLEDMESNLQLINVMTLIMRSSGTGAIQKAGDKKAIEDNPTYDLEVNTYSLQ